MRTVYVMIGDNKIKEIYDIGDFKRALEDIESNGYSAIDIKFDFNGDIVILCAYKDFL